MKGYIYEGLGNSFLITEGIDTGNINQIVIRNCLKHQLDGLINYDKTNNKMEIYNKDGSKALMCGNGIRCLANYLYTKYKFPDEFEINTDSGVKIVKISNENPFECQISLGRPRLVKELNNLKKITIDGKDIHFNSIYISTFHIVIIVESIYDLNLDYLAPKIYKYPLFQEKCNITFCQLVNHNTIKTRTYERGVGFTLSCGTGAAAGGYISYLLYNLSNKINVIQPLGNIQVIISNNIEIKGPSNFIEEVEVDV